MNKEKYKNSTSVQDDMRLQIKFSSDITNIVPYNSSFDKGVLRVAYAGKNRVGSAIEKEAFEKSIWSMYNCPVVCNYDIEDDTLGDHDIEILEEDGRQRVINITDPVGVVPESSNYWWDEVEEENGEKHDYLFIEVLLWKRQAAYRKIKKDGIAAQSMEIAILDGRKIGTTYHIYNFQFTAFCLIGVEPAYESSALEVFSISGFREKYEQMLDEFKKSFSNIKTKGGENQLDGKINLLQEFGLNAENIGFNLDDISTEDLRAHLMEKFSKTGDDDEGDEGVRNQSPEPPEPDKNEPEEPEKAPEKPKKSAKAKKAKEAAPTTEPAQVEPKAKAAPAVAKVKRPADDDDAGGYFSLTSRQIIDGIYEALDKAEKVTLWDTDGFSRYWFIDYDPELNEVYCEDARDDWKIYGFSYSMNGDNVVIDFESKTRKKMSFVDFDMGTMTEEDPMPPQFGPNAMFSAAVEENIIPELCSLREYKKENENSLKTALTEKIFSQFEDLSGDESFEDLKSNFSEYSLEQIEEKCYSIRGRKITKDQKFSANWREDGGTPKVSVGVYSLPDTKSDEPYNGVVEELLGRK